MFKVVYGRMLVIFSLILLLLLPPVMSSESREQYPLSQNSPVSYRSVDMDLPRTCTVLDVGEGDWIDSHKGLRLREGSYLELDPYSYKERSRFEVSELSLREIHSARTCVVEGRFTLLGYVKTITSPMQGMAYMLAISTDDGSSWNHIEVDRSYGTTRGNVEILVHEEKLFFGIIDKNGPSNIDAMVRVTPLQNCWNISSVNYESFTLNGPVSQTKMIGVKDRMLFFMKTDGIVQPRYYVYSNGTWSSEMIFGRNMGVIAPVRTVENNNEVISLLFFETSNPLSIRKIVSTDRGASWSSSPETVATSNMVMKDMVATGTGDTIHGAVYFQSQGSLGIFTSKGSLQVDIREISQVISNGMDPIDCEMTISSHRDDVLILFEDGNGRISTARSSDSGLNYELDSFGAGTVHSPCLSDDMKMSVFMNGTQIQIGTYERSQRGSLKTGIITVPALHSWDQMGLSLGGVENEDSFEFIVRDHDGMRIYPSVGSFSVHSSPNGSLGCMSCQHVVDLTGLNDAGTPDSVIFEFLFDSISGEYPFLFSIILNYTISYPFSLSVDNELYIASKKDVRVTSLGMELISGSFSGYGVFGPFKVEKTPPHHLWAEGKFLTNEDYCKFSIHSSNMSIVPGYEAEASDVLNTEGGLTPINWGSRTLANLPDSIDEFYVKVRILKTGTLSPRLTRIKLGSSTPPSIDSMEIEETEIWRTEGTLLRIEASDMEEDPVYLSLDVEVKMPGVDSWTKDTISEPLWNNGFWEVRVSTGTSSMVGDYSFRATPVDSAGEVGETVEMETKLIVRNNRPLPPLVSVTPQSPLTGGQIATSMVLPGEDVETPEEQLRYNIYIFHNGDLYIYDDNLTTPDRSYEDPVLNKGEEWEVHITTWDGVEESQPFIAIFEVGNSAPQIIPLTGPLRLEEDSGPVTYDPTEWFFDADGDHLTFEVNGPDEISPSVVTGSIQLDPEEDVNGEFWLWIMATDGILNSTANITVMVDPMNDVPEWISPPDISVEEGMGIFIDIGAEDERDGESVHVQMINGIPGMLEGENIFSYPNGSFYFIPDNAMVGKHTILFSVTDGIDTLQDSFNITVVNVNKPPSRPVTSMENEMLVVTEGDPIKMTAYSDDEDLIWGDVISYQWISSLEGGIGEGSNVTFSLGVGIHEITVTASDSENAQNSTTFTMEVLGKPADGGSVMRTWLLYTISGLIPLLIGIGLGILIIFLVRRKKEDNDGKEEVPPQVQSPGTTGSTSAGSLPGGAENLLGTASVRRELPPMPDLPVTSGKNEQEDNVRKIPQEQNEEAANVPLGDNSGENDILKGPGV